MPRKKPNSKLSTVKQSAIRADYDLTTAHEIIDAAIIGHVAIVQDGQPIVIPMAIARIDNNVYIHGLRTSRLMKYLAAGNPLSISITHVDGLVVSRSGMHCSANYRSIVIHGNGQEISGSEKAELLTQMTYKIIRGSEGDYRDHLAKELKATCLIAVPIEQFACKVRTGGPKDDPEDIDTPYWAGVIPITQKYGEPIPADDLPENVATPEYALNYR